jgi:malonate transporter
MLQTILTTLVPVAFVVFVGYVAGRKSLSAADRTLLTKLVINWLLPSLLLGGVLATPRSDLLNYKIPLIFLVGLMVPFLAVLLTYRFVLRYDRGAAALKAGLLAFPDMVFMGIPILHQLFGPSSLFPILVANLIPTLIIIPLTSLLLEVGSQESARPGSHVFASSLLHALRQPQVWAPIAGAALVLLSVPIPKFAIDSLQFLGQPTTGLSLFVVGLIVAEEKVRLTLAVAVDTLFKNLLHPAAMLVTVHAFGVTGALAREAVLLAAIPAAVITTMFAEEYGILVAESSTTILATRVLSFATISIVFMLTQHL